MNRQRALPLQSGTLAGQLEAACLLEAAARKPGNVHPQAAFSDLCFNDFVKSAEAVSPLLACSAERGTGRTLLDCVQATQLAVGKNTNLGILLLLVPLAAVPCEESLSTGVLSVLEQLTIEDSQLAYEAIRTAHPGGMGEVAQQDLLSEPTLPLREIMKLAASHDSIARQYANGFVDVLSLGLSTVDRWSRLTDDWETLVQGLFLELLAAVPDTLIERKLGSEMSRVVSARAQSLLQLEWPRSAVAQAEMIDFDRWLRADGHRRNPGTTADLVAGTLYAAIRERLWQPPVSITVHTP